MNFFKASITIGSNKDFMTKEKQVVKQIIYLLTSDFLLGWPFKISKSYVKGCVCYFCTLLLQMRYFESGLPKMSER